MVVLECAFHSAGSSGDLPDLHGFHNPSTLSLLLDTVVEWRSGARRLARPSAERIRGTTGPDDRLCHRRAAIGRAVLGGSSVGARVREERGARSSFGNAFESPIHTTSPYYVVVLLKERAIPV